MYAQLLAARGWCAGADDMLHEECIGYYDVSTADSQVLWYASDMHTLFTIKNTLPETDAQSTIRDLISANTLRPSQAHVQITHFHYMYVYFYARRSSIYLIYRPGGEMSATMSSSVRSATIHHICELIYAMHHGVHMNSRLRAALTQITPKTKQWFMKFLDKMRNVVLCAYRWQLPNWNVIIYTSESTGGEYEYIHIFALVFVLLMLLPIILLRHVVIMNENVHFTP